MSAGGVVWLAAAGAEEAADAAERLFRRSFGGPGGGEPDGVWAAPGRVNLIGEHLDYSGGPVLPLALPHRTTAAVRARTDGVVRLVSAADLDGEPARWEGRLDDVGPGAPPGWPAYAAGVLWALREAGHDVGGLDAAVVSTVPLGAGLSSSAALECVVAVAVADLLGLPGAASGDDAGRSGLAGACVRAENEVAGASTGGMDQAASLRCTADHALLLETSDGSASQVPLPLAAAGRALLVMDTRAPHRHAGGEYASRRSAAERAAAQLGVTGLAEAAAVADRDGLDAVLDRLHDEDGTGADELRRRTRHVVTETTRVREAVALLTGGSGGTGGSSGSDGAGADVDALGPVLDASHASMRDDYEISCAELDVVVGAAQAAGALGARMTGGGFGGSAVALVVAGDEQRVAEAVRAAALAAGHPEPAFLLAVPSAGATRLR